MMSKKIKTVFFSILTIALFVSSPMLVQAVTIKIGTIVPLRSPWIKELKKLGQEWSKITDGKVTIKIYPGGILGNEEDMVRKMRSGRLGGAVFTNRGINIIYPDSYVLSIPFHLNSDEELDYIMGKMTPAFGKEIEKKGFKVVAWAKAGWVYFFSKAPVRYPEDLKKHKISFTTDAPAMEQAWKNAGFHVIPNDLKDMMMALQSGMVNAFYLPPLMAASGQYFPLAPNMSSVKVAPLVGGIVISERYWKKVPPQHREKMIAVAQEMADNFFTETMKLEKEAMVEMKKHDLVIHQAPTDAEAKWKDISAQGMNSLVGKAFSKEVYDQLQTLLKEFRAKKK